MPYTSITSSCGTFFPRGETIITVQCRPWQPRRLEPWILVLVPTALPLRTRTALSYIFRPSSFFQLLVVFPFLSPAITLGLISELENAP